jgi:hypothetical protein
MAFGGGELSIATVNRKRIAGLVAAESTERGPSGVDGSVSGTPGVYHQRDLPARTIRDWSAGPSGSVQVRFTPKP